MPEAKVSLARPAALRFVLEALLLMGLFCAVCYYPYEPDGGVSVAIDSCLQAQARAAGALIALFDPTVRVHEAAIFGRFSLQVVRSCSSLDVLALYAATVLAFPVGPRHKLAGLLAGASLIIGMNLLRIASLYFVGAHLPDSFDAVHEELLPLLLLLASALAFVAFAHFTRGGGATRAR